MPDTKTLQLAASVDLVDRFNASAGKLIEMLGGCEPVEAKPGTVLEIYKLTGELSETPYVKGEKIPATKFTAEVLDTKVIEIKPYRLPTSLQDIQTKGYTKAVVKTDEKMLQKVQGKIKGSFVAGLNYAQTTTTGETFVAAAANAWANLQIIAENYGFGDLEPIFFANPLDFAECIGKSEVFSAFGISYVQNWAGLGTLVSTGSVAKGTLYVTAKSNMIMNYIPADCGNEAGFEFYTDETGYIAVCHKTDATTLTHDTVVWYGIEFWPEYADLIVKATINAGAAAAATVAENTGEVANG